ncbi:DUF2884 family protein [Salinimonas sediminis]|uniref:DUF2884 family protein n=1 Tax=Salinimonas sediminis TaxID=2303538 RepID=A0A346NQE2_9ALTE|nr:DUF2884 family protein [Salinimonas sediminis]AXR07749.1 DUF2884 family protein [Salinimonas sediminis]
MKMSAIALVLLTSVTPVMAHQNDSCDINLRGDVHYNPAQITLTLPNRDQVQINQDHSLYLNAQPIHLSASQQANVAGYYEAINEAVPMSMEMADKGLAMANGAVTEVFAHLLGEDDELVTEFQTSFAEMRQSLEQQFYTDDGSIKITANNDASDNWLGSDWEQEFEQRIEDLAERATGKLLMALAGQWFSSDDNLESFEQRMENFGEDLESRMEAQAEMLEQQAHKLCRILRQADGYETQMQRTIAGLDELNILDLETHRSHNSAKM